VLPARAASVPERSDATGWRHIRPLQRTNEGRGGMRRIARERAGDHRMRRPARSPLHDQAVANRTSRVAYTTESPRRATPRRRYGRGLESDGARHISSASSPTAPRCGLGPSAARRQAGHGRQGVAVQEHSPASTSFDIEIKRARPRKARRPHARWRRPSGLTLEDKASAEMLRGRRPSCASRARYRSFTPTNSTARHHRRLPAIVNGLASSARRWRRSSWWSRAPAPPRSNASIFPGRQGMPVDQHM